MEGIKDSNGGQDILILDENQPVDDSVVAKRIEPARAKVDARSGAGMSLCACLKNAREVRRLDIKTVAENLKIKSEQLEALEAGDVDAFPRFYALGFLRTYAAYLGEEAIGFSADEAVARFKEERQQFKKAQSFSFPVAITEARLPQAPVIAASGFAAAAIYGFWLMLAGPSYDEANAIPRIPAHMTISDAGQPVQEAPAGDAPARDADARDADAGSLSDDALGEVRGEIEVVTTTVDVAPAAETATDINAAPEVQIISAVDAIPAAGSSTGEHTDASKSESRDAVPVAGGQERSVAFRATQDAWVRIVRAGEAPIIEGVLHAGESVTAPAGGEVEIKTANPRALELLVDGELVGSVGGDDEVHQRISLDIDRLLKQTVHAN